jgi:hypothetical protein
VPWTGASMDLGSSKFSSLSHHGPESGGFGELGMMEKEE